MENFIWWMMVLLGIDVIGKIFILATNQMKRSPLGMAGDIILDIVFTIWAMSLLNIV